MKRARLPSPRVAARPALLQLGRPAAPQALPGMPVHELGRIAIEPAAGRRPLASPAWSGPPLLMRKEEKPGPAPQAPAPQDLCSRIDLSKLKLPRQRQGAEFFEVTVGDIRVLAAVTSKQSSTVKSKAKAFVAQVATLNKLVPDPSGQVKLVIVTDGASKLRTLCGQPVLIVTPAEFDDQTAVHETTHDVTDQLARDSRGSGPRAGGAKNFLDQAGDLFLRLSALRIQVNGTEMVATVLVDPSTLDPKAAAEHPNANLDEFLSSAVAAFVLHKAALSKKIQELGAKDPALKAAGEELLKLLDDFLNRRAFPPKPPVLTSKAKDVAQQVDAIQPAKDVDDATLLTSSLLGELLQPP